MLNIRKASNTDLDTVREIIYSVLYEYGLMPSPDDTDKDLSDLDKYYFDDGGYFAVAEIDNQIIASVGLRKVNEEIFELRKMYCLPEFRGRGFGKTLLEFSINKAKVLGAKKLILESATPLKEALALYKKYGFQEYKPAHLAARCDKAFELFLH